MHQLIDCNWMYRRYYVLDIVKGHCQCRFLHLRRHREAALGIFKLGSWCIPIRGEDYIVYECSPCRLEQLVLQRECCSNVREPLNKLNVFLVVCIILTYIIPWKKSEYEDSYSTSFYLLFGLMLKIKELQIYILNPFRN